MLIVISFLCVVRFSVFTENVLFIHSASFIEHAPFIWHRLLAAVLVICIIRYFLGVFALLFFIIRRTLKQRTAILRKKDVFNKSGLLVFFLLAGFSASGQLVKGRVIDAHTERPLEGISIKIKYGKTLSGNTGEFSLIVSETDTIWFSGVGYEPKYITARDWKGAELKIALKPASVELDEVMISGTRRNHKADSLKLRQEFAKEFNYQQPRFKDLFVNTSPSATRGRFEYVTLDVLQLVSLLGRKNNPQNKLKRRLLEDEERAYIASRFGKALVSSVTKLSGDSLQLFMDRYQPTREELLGLSDYDLFKRMQQDLSLFRKE